MKVIYKKVLLQLLNLVIKMINYAYHHHIIKEIIQLSQLII